MAIKPQQSPSPLGLVAGVGFDLWLAARGLRRRPWFAATAIVTLALGIGAMTAVFSVVDATVLRGIRIPDAEKVLVVWGTFDRHGSQEFPVSMAEFADLRTDVTSFARTGAWFADESLFEPRDGANARTVDVASTFGDVYAIVGARAVLGRLPDTRDDRLDAPAVAVLSHAFWAKAFGSDPGVIGTRPVRAGGRSPEIVGVLAPDVELPRVDADVWMHSVLNPASWATNRSGHGLTVVAQLRDGATEASARTELGSLQERWAARYPGKHSYGLDGHRVSVDSIADRLLGRARRVGWLLAIASVLLLVLACANVANLLLARGETRATELGLRVALGATSRRIAQPVVCEGLLIALAGAALGIGLAALGLPAILQLVPADFAQAAAARIDLRVMAFAVATSAATALLFTVVPAWRAVHCPPTDLLRASDRSRTGAGRGLRVLVAAQMAVTTCLLIGATLLAVSLQRLNAVSPGFDVSSRVTVKVVLPTVRFREASSIVAFYDLAQSRLAAMPEVNGVAAFRTLPLRDAQRLENVVREHAANSEDRLGVSVQAGSAGVLRALGIPLLDGRDLSAEDRAGAVRVALVSRAAARALWPGESPLGKRFRPTFLPPDAGFLRVIGVYGDVLGAGLTQASRPEIILPVAQAETQTGWIRNLRFVIHSSRPAADVIASARAALLAVDPGAAVEDPITMAEVLRAHTARERLLATLVAVFSVLALVVAAVGVFGVVSFTVARQTRTFAIRYALGARPGQVLSGILISNAVVAGLGAIAGTAVVALAAPAFGGFLYDVEPRNLIVLIGAPAVLVMVALAAALAPALKAARVPLTDVLQQTE